MSRKFCWVLLITSVLVLLPVWGLAQGRNAWRNFPPEKVRGFSPLMQAANSLDLKKIKTLLDAGANPNQISDKGWTPLMYACQGRGVLGDIFWDKRKASAETAQFLCNAGAQPNLQGKDGIAPMMLMAAWRNEQGVGVLLAMKANPHLQDKRGRTALTYSARENGESARLLLEAGIKPTLIDLMLLGKKSEVLDRLKTSSTIRGVGIYDETALFIAAENDWADVVKLLIERGADVNAANRDGTTPLMIAIGGYYSHGQVDGRRYWRKQGDRPEPDPRLPERIEVVKLLIKHGANVNAKMQDDFYEYAIYPLTIARETLSDQIPAILKQAGAVEYDKKLPSREKKAK